MSTKDLPPDPKRRRKQRETAGPRRIPHPLSGTPKPSRNQPAYDPWDETPVLPPLDPAHKATLLTLPPDERVQAASNWIFASIAAAAPMSVIASELALPPGSLATTFAHSRELLILWSAALHELADGLDVRARLILSGSRGANSAAAARIALNTANSLRCAAEGRRAQAIGLSRKAHDAIAKKERAKAASAAEDKKNAPRKSFSETHPSMAAVFGGRPSPVQVSIPSAGTEQLYEMTVRDLEQMVDHTAHAIAKQRAAGRDVTAHELRLAQVRAALASRQQQEEEPAE